MTSKTLRTQIISHLHYYSRGNDEIAQKYVEIVGKNKIAKMFVASLEIHRILGKIYSNISVK